MLPESQAASGINNLKSNADLVGVNTHERLFPNLDVHVVVLIDRAKAKLGTRLEDSVNI